VSGGEERSEQPTAKKLKEARQQGQFGRSADLGAWLGVGAGIALVPMMVRGGRDRLVPAFEVLDDVARDPQPEAVLEAVAFAGAAIVPLVVPIAAVTVVVAIAAAAAQGGLHFATKAAKPSAKKLNVLTGLKQMVSAVALWQGVKSLLKTVVIGLALWTTITGLGPQLLAAGSMPLATITGAVAAGTADMLRAAVVAGLALALVDVVVTKRKTLKQLRMTHQEVKDEYKASEGNPLIKGAIRSKQRAMSRNRMMAAVREADVVLVNPTHVAVALRYESGRGAPRVVAKGAGHVAAKIREQATEHGVPMVADIPLARALHAACAVDAEVPAHLYVAVAQVLAFVMALRRRGSARGVHRSPVTSAVA
jgi:flagellar biosynthetic protein FlhB